MGPILMPPLVSCMWASCCSHAWTPQICLSNGSAAPQRDTLGDEGFFPFPSAGSDPITSGKPHPALVVWAEWQLWTELGGTGALGTCTVQFQEVRLWTEAVKDFSSRANTWLLRKARLAYHCYYGRLRLWMENRWKTQGPACTRNVSAWHSTQEGSTIYCLP